MNDIAEGDDVMTDTAQAASGSEAVGAAVRKARERAGISQAALGEHLGVSQTAVSYWEAGKRDIGTADLMRIAVALSVPPPALLPGGDVPAACLGEYARVEIMGHDSRTGWVSDGSLAGAACLDVRDGTGRLVAKIPPHSVYLYQPLMPPLATMGGPRDGERRALPATLPDLGEITGSCTCPDEPAEAAPDCPEHGYPF